VIGGVCGGLGRYLGVDPVILRIAAVVLAIAGGSGLALYVIGWIVIPEERDTDPVGPAAPSRDRGNSAGVVFGALLIAVGGVLLVEQAVPRAGRVIWPLVLVGIGAMILFQGWRR
jgi:phage shock protein C